MSGTWTTLRHYGLTRFGRRWGSREALLQWQERRVQNHVSRMLKASPYYRRLAVTLTADRWRELPIMDKTVMMDNFDALNTVGIGKAQALEVALAAEQSRDFSPMIGGVTVGLSSGTSGNRGIFLVSAEERHAWTGTVLAKVLPGELWERQRIAFFLRANSNLYGSVQRRRLQFRFFDLLDPLESHLKRLNEYQPTLVVAPPSMLRFLAESIREGDLNIHPRKIVSVAEALDPLDERVICEAFGQKVHQIYQCTEGFLGFTCPEGTLHLNEDLVYFEKEYLDETRRKFVPVITDFSRTAQPMLRYRLNDILTEREQPCSCGSVLTALESIEGRCDDLFYWRSLHDQGLRAVFPDFIRRAIITASPLIDAYTAIQFAPDTVQVALRLRNGVDSETGEMCKREVERAIAALCGELRCVVPTLHFAGYDRLPSDKKLRRVERRFTP